MGKEQKIWEVRRYFDGYFETVMGKDLTYSEAKQLRDKLQPKPVTYTRFSIYKTIII